MVAWEEVGALGLPWQALGALFVVALLVSALGFWRVVYFISVGYAFSILAMALVLVFAFGARLSVATWVQTALLAAWGLRLGYFLVQRERQAAAYRAQAQAVHSASARTSPAVRVAIWLTVSLLYVAMFAPALFAAQANAAGEAAGAGSAALFQWLGVAVMAAGLLIEALADAQKSAAKAKAPNRFCDSGLYAWVRCPNYLGEILFWLGNFVAGVGFYAGWAAALLALVGFVCLLLIMLGSAKRLEETQDGRYGKLADYQAYVRSTPVLFPFVPLYSLRGLRVYLG